MLPTSEMAVAFGITARRVQQLTKEGILEAAEGERTRRYDVVPTVQKYIRYLKEKETQLSEEDENAERRKLKAEAKFKESKAEMAALQLKELRGQMHRSEDVEMMTSDLVLAVRGMLLAFPGRLAIDLSAISNPSEISHRLRAEICALLDRLSEYQYSPEKYAQRVRERQGWEVTEDDAGG